MPSLNRDELDKKVAAVFDQVVAWRRHIHENPELSYKEEQTAAYIAGELKNLDPEGKHLTITHPIPNGLWADLKGTKGNRDKIILLRADIDALPVTEEQDLPFKSKNDGVSHACGHDCHTAMLLGAAKLLCNEVDNIDGTVRFLFQPAEELAPGGMKDMLKAGCDKGVTMAFSEHVLFYKECPTGSVFLRRGVIFSSCDDFTVRVIGRGGHASMPELSVDPIAVSCLLITAVQSMVTRRLPSNNAPVLTIAAIHSSTHSFNVIGDEVVLKGTLRCSNEEVREKAIKYLEEVIAGVTASAGAKYEITYTDGYAMCTNHPDAFDIADRAAKQVLAKESDIVYPPTALKPADDFAFLAERVPAHYAGIGSYNEALGCTASNHSSKFKVDEECFKTGVKLHYGIIHETLISS